MKKNLILLMMLLIISCACHKDDKKYVVKYVPKADIKMDGILDEAEWQKANLINDFIFPWENTKLPKTEFLAFHDADNFYFSFVTEDDEIVAESVINNEEDLIDEDRVEIYLSLDDELKKYYCLEIDAAGHVLSYSASFHRQLDFSWNFPSLRTGAVINDNGYVVEAKIPLSSLDSLGFHPGDANGTIRAAIFRAQFNRLSDGKIENHWLSWIDPKIENPDFHVPASFGNFIFEKQ